VGGKSGKSGKNGQKWQNLDHHCGETRQLDEKQTTNFFTQYYMPCIRTISTINMKNPGTRYIWRKVRLNFILVHFEPLWRGTCQKLLQISCI
jgi:hypothetical protein